jgi:hypothetical protein
MSVFWDEGRSALEQWSRQARIPGADAWNPFLSPDPDQLLRVAVALGFRRGRLEDAYAVLRGRDPKTGTISPDLRAQQFAVLEAAQAKVLDSSVWKEFLQAVMRAGHRSGSTISSKLAVIYSYALFLVGKHDYGVPAKQLREVIARWFFMSALTARYSFSPETRITSDLAALPSEQDASVFVAHLDSIVTQQLTNDFWEIGLPGDLATSASTSPSLNAYLAALNILGSQVLFSKMKCVELADPFVGGGKAKVHRHHLFPRQYLKDLGIGETKQINQIANLTPLEWHDNLGISASDPSEYWPAYLQAMRNPPPGMAAFSDGEIEQMLHDHGLDPNWPDLEYDDFLERRRKRMAAVVRRAYSILEQGEPAPAPSWPPSPAAIEHLIQEGESSAVELKSSLRADTLNRGVPPKVIEKMVARTIAGFMNRHGGTLIIGVNDSGEPLGLDADIAMLARKDLDGFEQTLVQVVSNHLGKETAALLRFQIAKIGPDSRPVAVVDCPASAVPVFLLDANAKEFHVRTANTTRLLDIEEAASYIGQHWKQQAAAPATV